VCFTIFLTICSGCSSPSETTEKESSRYERKPEKVVNPELIEREYISSSKINFIEKISFEFDSNEKPVKGEKISTQKFDRVGFPVETLIYNNDGTIQSKYLYEYNSNGVRSETKRFDSSGRLVNIFKYDYNEYGNKSKAYRFDTKGNQVEYYIYNYDNIGNLIEEIWFDSSNKKIFKMEHEYNGYKKSQTETYDKYGNLMFRYNYKYDDAENIIEEIKYDPDGKKAGIIQYIYKYY
jgi:hypothetical protein